MLPNGHQATLLFTLPLALAWPVGLTGRRMQAGKGRGKERGVERRGEASTNPLVSVRLVGHALDVSLHTLGVEGERLALENGGLQCIMRMRILCAPRRTAKTLWLMASREQNKLS